MCVVRAKLTNVKKKQGCACACVCVCVCVSVCVQVRGAFGCTFVLVGVHACVRSDS